MKVLDSFLIKIGYKVDNTTEASVKNSINTINQNIDTVKSHAEQVTNAIDSIKGALIGLATATVFKSTFDLVNATSQKFATLGDVANEIGNTTASELAKFGYVLQQNGSTAEQAIDTYKELTKKIGDAVTGGGEGVEVFNSLGISLKDSNGNIKSTNTILDELSENLQGLERTAQVDLIDKLGLDTSILTALTSDTRELQQQFTDTYKAVNVDIDELATKSQDFQGSYNALILLFDVIKDALGAKFIDSVKKSIDSFRKIIFDNLPKITQVLASIITVINSVARAFLRVGEIVFNAVSSLISTFNNLSSTYKVLIVGMVALWAYMNNAFLRSPLGILFQLITAIGLLIDDFKTWKEGGQSLIDWNGKLGKALQFLATNPLARAIGGLSALMLVFSSIRAPILALLKFIPLLTASFLKFGLALLANPIGLIIVAITALITACVLLYKNFDTVKEKVTTALNYLKDKFSNVINSIVGFFTSLKEKVQNTIKSVIESVVNYFVNFKENILNTLNNVLDFLTNLQENIKSAFLNALNFVSSIFVSVFNGILNFLSNPLAFILDIPNKIKNVFSSLPNTLINMFSTFFDYLSEKFSWAMDAFNTVKDVVNNPLESAKNVASGAVDTVKGWLGFDSEEPQNKSTNIDTNKAQNSIKDNIQFIDTNSKKPLQSFFENTKNLNNTINNNQYLSTSNIYNSTNNNASTQNQNASKVINQTNGDVHITVEASKDAQATAEKIARIQQQINSNLARDLRRDIY